MDSDRESIERLVAKLGIEIEDSFLCLFKNDHASAANLSLYLLTYIVCRSSIENKAMMLQVILTVYRKSCRIFEDFDDLKAWVDDIRRNSKYGHKFVDASNQEDREDSDGEFE